jgi:hypothetical protein
VKQWVDAIHERLDAHGEQGDPVLSAGVEPLLDTVRKIRLELFPEPGESPPPPRKRELVREELTKALDQAEEVLEALLLSVPGAHPAGRGSEG